MISILLDAGHDINGNPRRVWVVLDEDGSFVETIDEEYLGSSAVSKKYPNVILGPTFKTTAKEYRSLLKFHAVKKKNKLFDL